MLKYLDPYSIRARLAPTIIILAPLFLTLIVLYPNFFDQYNLISTSAVFGFLIYLLTELGRDLGKTKEAKLFQDWGGTPTTQLLRHRTGYFNPERLATYHLKLNELTNRTLPSPSEEASNPSHADHVYDTCVATLRERTRDKILFPLVFQELVQYGFRRNLWAMKPTAIFLSIVSLIIIISSIMHNLGVSDIEINYWNFWQIVSFREFFSMSIVILLLVIFSLRVKPSWVKMVAYSYAEQLISSSIIISR